MIAEIYGKISRTGSNLHDRLEDNLTGDFFGALRYLPFNRGLKQILLHAIYPKSLRDVIKDIDVDYWGESISFWKRDFECEIDALIELFQHVIGIEVKYQSGLSSDDDISNIEDEGNIFIDEQQEQARSKQQLARESRMVARNAGDRKPLLIFIADEGDIWGVYENTVQRNILHPNVRLGIISWQDILTSLQKVDTDNIFEQLIIADLDKLLCRKGFEQFRSFDVPKGLEIDPYGYYVFDGYEFTFDFEIEVKAGLHYVFG